MENGNLLLGEQFKEIILKQINDNNPPISKETYNRLLSEGIRKEEVIRLMACVISNETYEMLKQNRIFDENKYSKMMMKLPKMPWD